MKRPLVFILFFYTGGILLGQYVKLSLLTIILAGLVFLLAGLINESVAWQKNRVYFLLAAAVLGIMMFQWQAERNRGNLDILTGKKVVLIGTVVEEPDFRINRVNYTVRVKDELTGALTDPVTGNHPKGTVLLTVKSTAEPYSYGERLEIRGTPELPEEAGNPGDFNYKKYLNSRGIHLIIKSWNGLGVRRLGEGNLNPVVDFCSRFKQLLVSVLNKTLSPIHAAVMEGTLFGSAGKIDYELKNDFAITGIIHILSVSGYHMALLAGMCMFIGNAFGLSRIYQALLTVCMTLLYVIMTGASPPVLRAAVMIWMALLARNMDREYDWPSSLSLAALVILLFDPQALFSPGFQLSFMATWGIFYLTPVIEPLLSFLPWLGKGITVTLAAQLAVLPITSYYFSYFSVISVAANLIIVPLVSLAMLIGSTGMFSGLIWLPLGETINISTALILDVVFGIAHFMARLPFSVITVKQPPVSGILVFYLVTIGLTESVRNREIILRLKRIWLQYRPKIVLAVLILAAVFIWAGVFYPVKDNLEVVFIDIGQGDAVLIKSPEGKNMLLDTGGTDKANGSSYDPGEKILVPFLRRQGISRVNLMLLTHPHADHIQGAESVLKYMDVDLLMVDPQFSKYSEGMRLIDMFRAKGTEIKEITGGESVIFDETILIEALYPYDCEPVDENNDSLVVRLGYGDFHVLFTGDAEQPALEQLTKERNIDSDIIKVPHHGSSNGWLEQFYREVQPELAVISVGENNYYGHPSGEVLAGLARLGIPVLRTDKNGAVIVRSEGHGYEVETGKGMK